MTNKAYKDILVHFSFCLVHVPVQPSVNIHRVQKKEATKLLAITFSNLNRFSKFFHCWIEDEYF